MAAGSVDDWEDRSGWPVLFPEIDFKELAFRLVCQLHGGSGLGLSYNDVADMELAEIQWWLERLHEQREAEAEALRKP